MTAWRDEKKRITREEAFKYVDLLEREMPLADPDGPVIAWYICGSWRRNAEMIGDFDILVVTKNGTFKDVELPVSFMAEHEGPQVKQGKLYAATKEQLLASDLTDVMNADFYACTPDALGAALMFLTGPYNLNIVQRAWANKIGYKLSQYGLFTAEDNFFIPAGTEEQVYERLGLKWINPVDRQNYVEAKPPDDSAEKSWMVRSDSGITKGYKVTRKGEGANEAWTCKDKDTGESCMAFKYNREIPRTCKHIKKVKAKLTKESV